MGILPIINALSEGSVADSYHHNPLFSVHLSNNIAWANRNVNGFFSKNQSEKQFQKWSVIRIPRP